MPATPEIVHASSMGDEKRLEDLPIAVAEDEETALSSVSVTITSEISSFGDHALVSKSLESRGNPPSSASETARDADSSPEVTVLTLESDVPKTHVGDEILAESMCRYRPKGRNKTRIDARHVTDKERKRLAEMQQKEAEKQEKEEEKLRKEQDKQRKKEDERQRKKEGKRKKKQQDPTH